MSKYKARGVMVRLGDDDNFLFHDQTRIFGLTSQWGISLGIRWGLAYFPIANYLAWGWREFLKGNWPNSWGHKDDELLPDGAADIKGVVKFPLIFPHLSMRLGRFRFYLGCKIIHWHPDYISWVKFKDVDKFQPDGTVLQLFAIRFSMSGGRE